MKINPVEYDETGIDKKVKIPFFDSKRSLSKKE